MKKSQKIIVLLAAVLIGVYALGLTSFTTFMAVSSIKGGSASAPQSGNTASASGGDVSVPDSGSANQAASPVSSSTGSGTSAASGTQQQGSQTAAKPSDNEVTAAKDGKTPSKTADDKSKPAPDKKSAAQHQTYPVIIPDKELINGIQPVDINQFDPDPSNWTTQQIVDYYKFGMAMEDNADVMTDQSFELTGKLEGKASILNGPVQLAMKLAAQPYNALTGGYWAIEPSDLKSADAHREGDYIVINLYPLDQTDGPNGDEHEGTVGHVVNVVQGIDDFIGYVEENFSILNAKYDEDSVVLKYTNAYAKDVKINTRTGKMESGTWGYDVDIYLDHCSMAGIEFDNFHTAMRWKCWYPVAD